MNSVGERLREARLSRGLTQAQLARGLATKGFISQVERNHTTPSLAKLRLMAERLGLPLGHFTGDSSPLELSYLPAGPYALYDLRLLLAENMAPNLDSELPDGEGMALLQWHQGHDNALTMPPSRNLADWVAERDALSFGVGCGFSLNSHASAP